MDNWIKIQTFDREYQAELNKQILEKNNISAVVINERDSLFLIGKIELFVELGNEKKAKALIDEFNGLTKINSFIELKPIELFHNILKENQIQSTLKRKESSKYIIDNFELYVKNEDVERVRPFLTGEKLEGWVKIESYKKVRQALFIIQILEEEDINTIVIKKKDSSYHLEEIFLYVEKKNLDTALGIIEKLDGYKKIRDSKLFSTIETYEESLVSKGIKALIISKANDEFELFVEEYNVVEAEIILNTKAEWVELKTFNNIMNAEYSKSVLEDQNISSVIINEKGSSFMLGKIELHVEKLNLDKALDIIKNI